ncbi:unnamed protein product [Acanthoscelides obtectus]|uniref:Peptidyl-prolyl cis-trans isomerase n=1 Tax=Acanthoscelides obtectus TaxID=200917 RepID=A0A9P0LYS9_ACAOB|nr:unnamed protein product [Acanthoscelides obtectus]CAK1652579.1 Peptidyl-prolyl cis-trans isomerase, rhodopsin-specific isozyme [Acanthoscelides obtectus]
MTSKCLQCSQEYKITDQIYFDVHVDDGYLGRIVFGLFGEEVPKTVKNFKEIALNGIDGKTYVGTKFHTAIERLLIQGGDILYNNGTGFSSIYGKYFDDENFTIKPDSSGLLVMVNHGPNTNGCQFFITTMAIPWIEDTNVVFGKVLKGAEVVHRIEHYKTDVNDKILRNVVVTGVGEITGAPFYEPSKNYELTLWAWIKAGWFPLAWSFTILAFFQMVIKRLDRYIEIKEGVLPTQEKDKKA